MTYDYRTLDVLREDGILWVTIDNPPINLFTLELYQEMVSFTAEAEVDEQVKVIVMDSADDDFWIAHFDVEAILSFDTTAPNRRRTELNDFHRMCERMRTMPRATIAHLNGRLGGGGSEFAASFDMRFGDLSKTRVNQMEVALGILPGGGGTQRLPRLLGGGRALEVILGSDDLDARTAEAWGYLNRALPSEELAPFVERLARRINSFPQPAIALAKQATLNAERMGLHEGLLEEEFLFQELLRTGEATVAMQRFLELGGQTREAELDVARLAGEIGRPDDEGGA